MKKQAKKPTKKAPKKTKAKAKPKKKTKIINLDGKQVYEFYSNLLKTGKGAIALSATADKFRVSKDIAYVTIKSYQDSRMEIMEKEKRKIKDPIQKAKFEQVTNASMIKSAEEQGKHLRERQIGVSKDQRWEHGPRGHLNLLQKVFRNYCEVTLGYNRGDSAILMEIFNQHIDLDNIPHYICRTAEEIYIAIINNKLPEIANYVKAEDVLEIDLETLEITKKK